MHIVRFQGGFANQLFQLCLYEKLKILYNKECVYADISHYKKNKDHGGFKLERFFSLNYIRKVPQNCINIDESNFYNVSIDDNSNYFYNGYWQSETYFSDNIDFLSVCFDEEKLNRSNKEILSLIKSTQSVSVHIRRGDYVDNYFHGNIANSAYIYNAINYVKKQIPDAGFFIFSDDIQWCKENIKLNGVEVYYVAGNSNDVELDMLLMSKCKHNIIANSSFSWWAQRLNTNKDKIVISPEYWFNDYSSIDTLNSCNFIHIKNILSNKIVNENPRFSILVPVYNTAMTLRRCLAYALNQSYLNIEIIVVDDASTDDSYNILTEYSETDLRLKVIRKEKNESLLSARIAAMKKAKGDYILFLDSDDYCSLDLCKVLDDELSKEPTEILEFAYMHEPEKSVIRDDYADTSDMLRNVLECKCHHTIWNKCYSIRLVEELLVNANDFYCNMTEDSYFVALFYSYARSYRRIPNVLYHYLTSTGMSKTKEMTDGSMRNAIESIYNKNENLRLFLTENRPDYLSSMHQLLMSEEDYMADVCRSLNQSLTERIQFLKMLDDRFETNYASQYEHDVNTVFENYNRFRSSGWKGKTKIALRCFIRYMKKHI